MLRPGPVPMRRLEREAASGRCQAQEQGGGEAQSRSLPGKGRATFGASYLKCRTASNSSSQFGIQSPIWVSFWPSDCPSLASVHVIPENPLPFPQDLQVQPHAGFGPQPKSHLHGCLFFETFPFLLGITTACARTFLPEKPSSLAKSQSTVLI